MMPWGDLRERSIGDQKERLTCAGLVIAYGINGLQNALMNSMFPHSIDGIGARGRDRDTAY